ncbi:DUF1641 domain-containing protein [Bacillus massiliglaciei]|uniref:DUF1641 domain-containing protein n=1 Tax=Bacillus massiliglaciei TaxID=1816693 RepID=UPI000AE08F95|nr:DUF1641 domain-containing protein [Bacillus massiliglaciei]
MAKAIKQINRIFPTEEELKEKTIHEMLSTLADNRDAITTLIEIVNQLQDVGVWKAINGFLANRLDIGSIAIEQLNQPAMHNTIKNGMNAFKFVGSIPPDQLAAVMAGVGRGLEKASSGIKENEKTSLWKLGSSMRSPEVRQSLAVMTHFLEGMGEVFMESKENDHHKEGNPTGK